MEYLDKLNSRKDEFINDLSGLIAIPSLRDEKTIQKNAPFGKECRNALDYMLNLAKEDGFAVDDVDGYAGVISYGEGDESVAMLGHLDVVPVDNEWSTNPFELVIKDGIGFGRGILDDKGPTMAAYYALKMLKESKVNINKRIQLILGCDEESGMECMKYYKENRTVPTLGFVPDADFPVIYGEKGILNFNLTGNPQTQIKRLVAGSRPNVVIGYAEVLMEGQAKVELFESYLRSQHLEGQFLEESNFTTYSIKGLSFHGSMPQKGINAALHLLQFVYGAYQDEFAGKLSLLLGNPYGKGLKIDNDGSYMSALTMNLGIIAITPEHTSVTIDVRYPNDITSKFIVNQVKQALLDNDVRLEIKDISDSKPLFVDPQSELVTTCMDVYRAVSNDTFSPAKTMGGGTYARVFENMVAYGPEFPTREKNENVGGPHEKNEGFLIDDLLLASSIYAKVLEKLVK